MNWLSKVRVVVLNLCSRDDRLLLFTEMMEEYSIPFERIPAIKNRNGAEGLRDTMVKLFTEELERGTEHLLVFEDDALFLESENTVHYTMNNVMSQYPPEYAMIYLGCQITGKVYFSYSAHLFKASKLYSTHSVLYSRKGMQLILGEGMDYPIDNWYVNKIEPIGASYCINPLLCTQRKGFSDICQNEIDWNGFIQPLFSQKVGEFRGNR